MWVIYALLSALFLATGDALTKRVLANMDEYLVAWCRLVFSLPLLMAAFLFIEVPELDRTFWLSVAIALPLEILAIILYTKALKVSPMSLTIPFLALTPVFLIAISYILLGEKVSLMGAAGIILIAVGGYILNIHKARLAMIEPIRAIFREKGSVMMIVVAFIYSITSSMGKKAIEHSSPLFFGGFYFILVTTLFTPIAIGKNRDTVWHTFGKREILPLILIGITQALMIIFHMLAISLAKVAYMIAVKRMSLIFSVIYGYLIFREEKIAERTVGTLIMLAGFVLIVLSRQ